MENSLTELSGCVWFMSTLRQDKNFSAGESHPSITCRSWCRVWSWQGCEWRVQM